MSVQVSRPLAPDLRSRVAKLILMLSSDSVGERASAALAIGRTLAAAERDWHDLVAVLVAPPTQPNEPASAADDNFTMSDGEICNLVGAILKSRAPLSPASRSFLNSLRARAVRYDAVFLSPKQLKWLNELAQRARAGARS
jgi:hypothetical protein